MKTKILEHQQLKVKKKLTFSEKENIDPVRKTQIKHFEKTF
jgi:hypothetical protein